MNSQLDGETTQSRTRRTPGGKEGEGGKRTRTREREEAERGGSAGGDRPGGLIGSSGSALTEALSRGPRRSQHGTKWITRPAAGRHAVLAAPGGWQRAPTVRERVPVNLCPGATACPGKLGCRHWCSRGHANGQARQVCSPGRDTRTLRKLHAFGCRASVG